MLHLKSVEGFAADFNMERTVLLLSPCAGAATAAPLPLKPQQRGWGPFKVKAFKSEGSVH